MDGWMDGWMKGWMDANGAFKSSYEVNVYEVRCVQVTFIGTRWRYLLLFNYTKIQ